MIVLAACKKCRVQYDVSKYKTGLTLACPCGGTITVAGARTEDARLVRCGSCGAVRGGGGLNCEFCGARFSSVDKGWGKVCPGCFCRLPNDAEFCVECGLKINVQKLDEVRAELLCARCKNPLQARMLDKVRIFECAACGGMWVPDDVFKNLCSQKETIAAIKDSAGLGKSRRRFELSTEEEVKYIPCPSCKSLMNRRNFGHLSGVIIDTCRDHGVWLDNQELNRIIQFIESGGLERAHELEAAERQRPVKAPAPAPFGLLHSEQPTVRLDYSVDLALDALAFIFRTFLK